MNNTLTSLRSDFPFFNENPGITYLDSAATSLKPNSVIQAVTDYYTKKSVNVHRGVYELSNRVTGETEQIRNETLRFINGDRDDIVLFTKGTTESINLLAYSLLQVDRELADNFGAWAKPFSPDDVILLSESEHHANLVPWYRLSQIKNFRVLYIPVTPNGSLDLKAFGKMKDELRNTNVRLIALSSMSNVTGIHHNLSVFSEYAKEKGAVFCIDAAQSVCHGGVDKQNSGADFIYFSAHKMLGPTGLGFLSGKKKVFDQMPPFQSGGSMISKVEKNHITYLDSPYRFEAGTPAVAEILGWGAAMKYFEKMSKENLQRHENNLLVYTQKKLEETGVRLYGPSCAEIESGVVTKAPVFSFDFPGVHAHDIGTLLDESGICVRAGHHCCQLLMQAFKVPATARAGFYFYNSTDDADKLIEALRSVKKIFRV